MSTHGCRNAEEALAMQEVSLFNDIDKVFFDEQCLRDHCYIEEVAGYMDYISSELRFENIVGTELCLLLLFLLLQLGGIPNPRTVDEKSYTPLGSFIWLLWMLFVCAQFIFTFLSLLMAILATFGMVTRYSTCFARFPLGGAGLGAGVGCGVGAACGGALFALTKAVAESEGERQATKGGGGSSILFLVLSALDKRSRVGCLDKFYGGEDSMGTLCFDVAKCVLIGALGGTIVGGAWGYVTSGASLFGALIPSLLWSPVFLGKVVALLAHLFTGFQGLVAAGFSVNPDRMLRIFANVVVMPSLAVGLLYWLFSGSVAFSFLAFPLTLCVLACCRAIFWVLLRIRRVVVGKKDKEAAERKKAKGDSSWKMPNNNNNLATLRSQYSREGSAPISPVIRALDLEAGTGGGCNGGGGGAPAVPLRDDSIDDPLTPTSITTTTNTITPTAITNKEQDTRAAIAALDLKIRQAIQESNLDQEQVLAVLTPLFEATGGEVDVVNLLEQAFWWLPPTLWPSVKKQWLHDCVWISNALQADESKVPEPAPVTTILVIVLYSSALIVLIPMMVFGSWTAFYVFLRRGVTADASFVRTCYNHFFQVLSGWHKLRSPSIVYFNFNLTKQLKLAFQAFLAAPGFDTAPPLLMLKGSKGFAALSFLTAVVKPLVSALAEVFVAFQALPKSKMVAEVALASSDFSSVIQSHSAKADHAELIQGLKTKGLDVSKIQQNATSRLISHFLVPNQQKFDIDLEVFETGNFNVLEELHLGGCILVAGELNSLAQCLALKELTLSYCNNLEGSLEGLCSPPSSFSTSSASSSTCALTKLDLSHCKHLCKGLAPLAAYSNLESLILRGCSGLVSDNGLSRLSKLSHLTLLDLTACTGLKGTLEGVGACQKLHTLLLGRTLLSGTFEPLQSLSNLNVLDCRSSTKLTGSLDWLKQCTALVTLNLAHCTSLDTTLEGLSGCTNLEKLDLTGCSVGGIVKPLISCPRLKELVLKDCKSISGNLLKMAELNQLRVLDVSFTNVKGTAIALKECRTLELLDVTSSGVTNIKDFIEASPHCKVRGDGGFGGMRRGMSRRMSFSKKVAPS